MNFINSIAEDDIKKHIEDVSQGLRKLLNLKSTDFKLATMMDAGHLSAPILGIHIVLKLMRMTSEKLNSQRLSNLMILIK